MAEATPSKKLNKAIAHMIVNWVNNFEDEKKIKSLKELVDGSVMVSLIFRILRKHKDEATNYMVDAVNVENINDRYELIRLTMESQFFISSGISYDEAKKGKEYELAKMILITLITGVAMEIHEFVEALEKLDVANYQLIHTFYYILEREKSTLPPKSIHIYEEFLCLSNNDRRSLNASLSRATTTTTTTITTSSIINQNTSNLSFSPNLLSSPLKNTYLNSPRSRRHYIDEELQNEKRKHEREIQKKDLLVYELSDQIKDREEKLKEYENLVEEYKRRIVEMNNFKERAYEYESLIEKLNSYEKDNKYLEEKCKKISINNDELVTLRESYEKQQAKIITLNEQLRYLEEKEMSNELELVRFKRLECELEYIKEAKLEKEDKILKLIDEKSKLENQILTLNENLNQVRTKYTEQFEELSGESAMYQNKLNCANAQLANLKEETDQILKEKNELLRDESKKNQLLEIRIEEMKNHYDQKYQSLSDEKQHLQEEHEKLTGQFVSKCSELSQVQSHYDTDKAKWNVQYKSKCNDLSQLEDNYEQEKTKLNAELSQVKAKLEEKNKELADLESSHSQLNEKLNNLTSSHEAQANELEQTRQEIQDLKNSYASKSKELEEANIEIQNLKSAHEAKLKELEDAQAELESLTVSHEEKLKELEDVEIKIQNLKVENDRLGDLLTRYDEAHAEIADLKQLNEQLVNEHKENLSKLAELNECQLLIDQFRLSHETLTNENKESQSKLDALRVEISDAKMQIEQLKVKNERLINEYQENEKRLNQKTSEIKDQLESDLNSMLQKNEDYCKRTLMLEAKVNELEKENISIKQSLNQASMMTETKTRECEAIRFELNETKQKLADMDIILNLRNTDIKQLETNNEELKNEYDSSTKKLVSHIDDMTKQFNVLEQEFNREKEKNLNIQKKLREEITNRLNELEGVKNKLRSSEEREKLHLKQLEELNQNVLEKQRQVDQQRNELNELKPQLQKLISDNTELISKCQRLENESLNFKNYGSQLDQHYQKKKALFEKTNTENSQLKTQLGLNEKRVRQLNEELNFLKEKIKTINFENQQLKSQKDEMAKKISEFPGLNEPSVRERESRDSMITSSAKINSNNNAKLATLSTPIISAPSKSYDDSNIRYTAGLRNSDDQTGFYEMQSQQHLDDMRRFSIDSWSARSNSNQVSGSAQTSANSSLTNSIGCIVPSFNRFSTVFENGFEEVSVDSKSFTQQSETPQTRRLSTLQARNQQAKPHLKSSYPLEGMMMSVSENQIREGKENVFDQSIHAPRLSQINSKTFIKRTLDGENSAELLSQSPTKKPNNHDSGVGILRQSNL